ncbi:ribosomal protein S7 domain-containing protein [Tribonema minus]|uniref:Ribosomal protein S7 domain-containing protein n=1 Tax=Tribonema minus TaxID=303371 RepID=A0A835Z2A7_9STRA|nr:ribosomal protein S7 domain-containing protein [Tribonema minus]|eukprot:TRINITY_DN22907_c0_g1_i1.p1 TRINITY_DN22907_c0_g1~~TRINITY_DN22907_c0_g1_i1.p1  ORF type:complete len:144 (+),score=30.04 TRINITY_DN22907_c0_g1_i1:229-660(+)
MSSVLRTPVAQKLVKLMMHDGKKHTAEHVLLGALDHIRVVKKENALASMYAAIAKVSPLVEVRTIRVRGQSYQVPLPLSEQRSTALGLRLLVRASRKSKQPMHKALGEEMVAASKGQGEAIKQKREMAKVALEARAFAHFRWF